jgi:hypothetical protein
MADYQAWPTGDLAEALGEVSCAPASEVGPLTIQHSEWRFSTEASRIAGDVWFYINVGSMSGGTLLPASVARKLGEALIAHANHAEAA